MRRTNDRPGRERGYSLIETLIAMAILATVLMSVLTLFVWGRKNVYSGRQMTRAVSVGTRVMEDLSALTRENVEDGFNLGATALGSVTIGSDTYADSVVRHSTDAANDTFGYLGRWNALMAQQNFSRGLVSVVVTPIDPTGTATIAGAPIYKIRVYVQWNEEARRRSIILDTTKVDRLN